jgi:hypothetical protein
MGLPPSHRRALDSYASLRRRTPIESAPPPRPGARRAVERGLDRLTSQIVRETGTLCVLCGEFKPALLTCGHVFKRGHRAVRWDTHEDGNCHVLCRSCNARDNEEHGIYVGWYIERFGAAAYALLASRAGSRRKMSDVELEELLDERRIQYERLRRAA